MPNISYYIKRSHSWYYSCSRNLRLCFRKLCLMAIKWRKHSEIARTRWNGRLPSAFFCIWLQFHLVWPSKKASYYILWYKVMIQRFDQISCHHPWWHTVTQNDFQLNVCWLSMHGFIGPAKFNFYKAFLSTHTVPTPKKGFNVVPHFNVTPRRI